MTTRRSMFLRWARRTRSRAGGFTLVELLVAITITAVLAGFSLTLVGAVSGLWKRTNGWVATEAQARHMLDQLELDLSGAWMRDDGRTWLAFSSLTTTANSGLWDSADQASARAKPDGVASLSYVVTPEKIADARGGVAGGWLRFFTMARGSNDQLRPQTTSAPIAVGYQIIRRAPSGRPDGAEPRRYLFHRAVVGPVATNGREGVMEKGYDLAAYDHLRTPDLEEILGDNVIDFTVRFYCRESSADGRTALRLIFPANGTGALDGNDLVHAANRPARATEADSECFPDVVDVMVRILSEEGAVLIAGYESTVERGLTPAGVSAAQHWWRLAEAHSRVFTRRIAMRAQPL